MLTQIEKYIPNFNTSDSGWIRFHKELDAIFNKTEANKYWTQAWANTGGADNYNANTSKLREYMKKKGILIDAPTAWQTITDAKNDAMSLIKVYVWFAVIVVVTVLALKMIVFNDSKK